jgi:hypothetical protein
VDDLKRFSIKVLLIDEFDEVTDILAELVRLYELGRELIARGSRVATGLGVGIGDAIFTGALREAME